MASDRTPGNIPVASLVQGSQAATSINVQSASGNTLPPDGNNAAHSAAQAVSTPSVKKAPVQLGTEPHALVQQLNKFLNDSGLPEQFRLDPASGGKLIQQINPATGAVVGEFSAVEFPALARSVGVSGLLIDKHA